MTEVMTADAIWARFADAETQAKRPEFRLDPDFYVILHTDVAHARLDPTTHYAQYGRWEGRISNRYRYLRDKLHWLDAKLAPLAADPDIRAALAAGQPDILEVLFELMQLGDPVDKQVSHFSRRFYLSRYADIKAAGVDPLMHFLERGQEEGRASLREMRENMHPGAIPYDPDRPTLLIAMHEFSKTGAPIVGLDMVRSAARSHNVVVMGLRGGALLDNLTAHATCVIVADAPDQVFDYFEHPALAQIEMAVLNSVETFLFAPLLVRRGIPWASYIHEYADYTRPAVKAVVMSLFSDLLVFSSDQVRQSWGHVLRDLNVDLARDSIVLPQCPFRPDQPVRADHEAARRKLGAMLGQDLTGRRVVAGAGHVQWRKGTDLFVLTAQIARAGGDDSIYIWIGDGLNHEDMNFGVWMDKHLRASGANEPGGTLHMLPAGPHYRDVLRAADVFYLPSRLDPLPNVVFDAAEDGCQIVIFAQGSGFDDPAYAAEPTLHKVEYGNLADAAATIRKLPLKQPRGAMGKVLSKVLRRAAPPVAAAVLPQILAALKKRLAQHKTLVTAQSEPGSYDVTSMFGSGPADAAARIAERQKIWRYQRHFIWPSSQAAKAAIAASDNWVHRHLRIDRFARRSASPLPAFAVHIHAHYIDTLADDLQAHLAFRQASRIVVTTDTPRKAERIAAIGAACDIPLEVVKLPNTGRDILPFLRLFTEGIAPADAPEAIWCHVHQKKSLATSDKGDIWKSFLLSILLGDDTSLSDAIDRIASPGVGLVAPFDPFHYGWNESRRLLPRFAARFPAPLPDHPILFPQGNMFWTRTRVAQRMAAIFGPDYPWPNEPLPNDGTEYHLIERLWPTAAAMEGLDSLFLDNPDQPRG
jgi:glycosyltransferase involved in cell wall biosynthesis